MADHSYQLYVRRGPMPGEFFMLTLPTLIIGRDPLSDILIRDPEVSRNHARLTLTKHGYEIQDMGSTNGTFIEGSPLRGEPHALQPGELVTLGSNVVLEYQQIEMSNADPLATMMADNMNVSPDRPLPQATGRLAEDGEDKADQAEDFSAFGLFNEASAANENDADQGFSDDEDEAYFSSAPQNLPQVDNFGSNDQEFSPPPSAPVSSRDRGRESQPSAPPSPAPKPAKKNNTLLTILAIVLIVLVALCCFFLAMTIYFLYDANLIGLLPKVLTTAV